MTKDMNNREQAFTSPNDDSFAPVFVARRVEPSIGIHIRVVHADDDSTCYVGDAQMTVVKGSDLTAWIEPVQGVNRADEYRFKLYDGKTYVGVLIIGRRDLPHNYLHLSQSPTGPEPVRLGGFGYEDPDYPFIIKTIQPDDPDQHN